jgi:hypothetical protein
MNSICIRFGNFKSDFQDSCSSCSFTPEEDIDVVKSRILSFPWIFTYGQDGETVETGRTSAELKVISNDIKNGKPYAYPEEELQALLLVWQESQNVTPRQLIIELIKWVAPVIIVIVIFVYFWFFKIG